uniref:Uncharacterized protein n=1 Tax=Megaselia scalaris TaxID=36166 RepID=T1GUR5_MEGSC
MKTLRLLVIFSFVLMIGQSSARPGIIGDTWNGLFGSSDDKFSKGYEQGLRDNHHYVQQPNYHYNQQ